MTDESSPEAVLWLDAAGAPQAAAILEAMERRVRPIGVGGPRSAEIAALARGLGCACEDDLRKLVVERPATFLVLLSVQDVNPDELLLAIRQGAIVISTEPVLSGLEALGAARGANSGGTAPGLLAQVVQAPAFTRCAGWTSAADPLQVIGAPQVLNITSFGRPDEGSLFSRLMDAWRTVLSLAPMPDSIDAALVGPLPRAPENLRAMTGHLTAHGRRQDGPSALVQASDRSPTAARDLIAFGDGGQLRVSESHYAIHDGAGALLDSRPPDSEPASFARLVAAEWRRLLDRLPASPGADAAASRTAIETQALACCTASLLSARTGEPESPVKLIDLHRGMTSRAPV